MIYVDRTCDPSLLSYAIPYLMTGLKQKNILISMTLRHRDRLQGQEVTQAAVTSVTTETSVHTTESSYASIQTTSSAAPSSVSSTLQPKESSGATQSSGASSSTSLDPTEGSTATNRPQTSATTLKAGSAPVVGSFSLLLLPVMVLTYSAPH